jgi:endonuclease/exonuclease/phosphatase family metal-dependent hydrolase
MPAAKTLTVASYNIHGGIGTDRFYDPSRIVSVMKDLNADVYCLQEVDSRHHPGTGVSRQLDYFAKELEMVTIPGPTILNDLGHFGNAILTRLPVSGIRKADVTVEGREPRGVLDIDVNVNGIPVRILDVHFGLTSAERHFQVKKILTMIDITLPSPLVIMGDFNEWKSFGFGSIRRINRVLGKCASPVTFPSWLPMLSLDRVWIYPKKLKTRIEAFKSPVSRLASDHLPLKATIQF